jgi:hypothetical protein
VSIILSAASMPVMTLMAHEISIDAGLWAGIALCAISILHRPASGSSSFSTWLAFGTAVLLTSLALVEA